jgi:uncharacterized membrane protein
MVAFFPFAGKFSAFLALTLFFIFILIEIDVVTYAFERIGINHRYVFAILLLSFLGSSINIPIAQLISHREVLHEITSYGWHILVPTRNNVVVEVNVGGAVIPLLVSLYLLLKMSTPFRALFSVAIVAAISNYFATPVRELGITIPTFIPPILAAGCAIIFNRREAPQIAYIAGSMGTLIGADLLNLPIVTQLGSRFVSIGGAGTFDGIFFSSIIAVLLVSI